MRAEVIFMVSRCVEEPLASHISSLLMIAFYFSGQMYGKPIV
jgi:hypothetical protein